VLYGVSDSQLELFWAHPPWTALAMVPFGALPMTTGVLVWHAVLVIAGLAVLVAGHGPWACAAVQRLPSR
jgi:hypothetical protein